MNVYASVYVSLYVSQTYTRVGVYVYVSVYVSQTCTLVGVYVSVYVSIVYRGIRSWIRCMYRSVGKLRVWSCCVCGGYVDVVHMLMFCVVLMW